jgi:16S rRNA (cytosine1402-N4)-methyltransferase
MTKQHTPVLLQEVIECLNPKRNENFIDATVGFAGHAESIMEQTSPKGILVGIDRDETALGQAQKALKPYGKRFHPFRGNFTAVREAADGLKIDGILADLGISSLQVDEAERGFSFRKTAILDMRMDRSQKLTAADVVNNYSQKELADIIGRYSDERFAVKIAKNIVESREKEPITTTTNLAEIVEKSIPRRFWPKHIHPATRTFQAIRMAVNLELESLEEFMPEALEILNPGGRLAVISFHGLEDEIVRDFMKREANPCECPPDFPTCVCGKKPTLKIITKQPIKASDEEVEKNPRARSARLRVAEKI